MFDLGNLGNKMANRFFRKVNGVVWDLMSGKIGILADDGIVTVEGEGEDAEVSINMMDQFGIAIPAFAQNTPVESLKLGDLIFNGKKVLGWITECPTEKKKTFNLIKPDGTRGSWTPPKVQMLGFDGAGGAMVLKSLINLTGDKGLGDMQSMLMPMLMMGDGDLDFESIMPMMLFSQMNGGGKDSGGMMGGNMFQTMMMMQMMSGKKGSNPLKGMMGGGKGKGFFDSDED